MKIDLTNQKFGRLTAKESVHTSSGKEIFGGANVSVAKKEEPAAYLRNGHTRSCGCLNK